MEAGCPRASVSRGAVFKEPPNRSSLECSKNACRIKSPNFLAFAPSAHFDHTHKGRHFTVLPHGPRKSLGGPVY